MKDSRCAEEFVSASSILTGCIQMLDVLGSFGQKLSAIFFLTAFTFVASSLYVILLLSVSIFRTLANV